jgi:hypothetical protein
MLKSSHGALPLAALIALSSIALQLAAAEPAVSDAAASAAPPVSAPICLEAAVSPVSGYAECVNPQGAPVERAPPRPDAGCAQQREPCTDPSKNSAEQM